MARYNIPTAECVIFSSHEKALHYISAHAYPTVVKADGLASGKGVFVCRDFAEAKTALATIRKLNLADKTILVEEYLEGIEVSAHAICTGTNFLLFPLAQDHKRLLEGNRGPNTGGMGTICPVPGPEAKINEIITKVLSALKAEGREFTGCLFPGIMITSTGPKVLEFNARFGDPETQVYMRLLNNDLLEVLEAAALGRLNKVTLSWRTGVATCIVLASAGYPTRYELGVEIAGLADVTGGETVIFHAGTRLENDKILTAGGRVLNITTTGQSIKQALKLGYDTAKLINFKGKTFRQDIGFQFAL